jgi:hypothetical protein
MGSHVGFPADEAGSVTGSIPVCKKGATVMRSVPMPDGGLDAAML